MPIPAAPLPGRPLLLAGLLLAALLPGACAAPLRSDPPEAEDSCAAGQAATEATLYFGRAKGGGGTVGEAEWIAFLDEEITPRFPDGLTVLDGHGQWRADAAAPIHRERSKILVVVLFDLGAARPRLEAAIEAYKARFRQQSVLLVTQPVCAAF